MLPLCVGNVRNDGIADACRRAFVSSTLVASPAPAIDCDRAGIAGLHPELRRRRAAPPI
jgi:hypothetical protein